MPAQLKYKETMIVFQEVPNEVSLAINVTGCPYHCIGCHSPHLWEDAGTPLLDTLASLIEHHHEYITCVAFMGGDHNLPELAAALAMVKTYRLKTCLYTGSDSFPPVPVLRLLDYIKLGPYWENAGGLNSPTTNQRFFKVEPETLTLTDQTYLFRRKEQDDPHPLQPGL